MPPHFGTLTGMSVLQLSCLSLLSVVEAFELSHPSFTFPGVSFVIFWTLSQDDPTKFDLDIGSCADSEQFESGPFLSDEPAIDAQASNSRNISIPKALSPELEFPVACFVQAFDSSTGDLITSNSILLEGQGPSSI
ncbi:hypothetical protein J132_10851 [Termitomyces sp. J132]|nr:hypothetical protein J132_10851 [Termitomyces sp. J132]